MTAAGGAREQLVPCARSTCRPGGWTAPRPTGILGQGENDLGTMPSRRPTMTQAPGDRAQAERGVETVLLADDDAAVRRTTADLSRRLLQSIERCAGIRLRAR